IGCMMKDWSSSTYAFFSPVPDIVYIDGRRCHVFSCLRKSCKYKVRCFLDTRDKGSTGNMQKHVQSCWGNNVLKKIDEVATLDAAHEVVKKYSASGSFTSTFE
ncbi:hypothetical protein SCLCIDRAFT_105840, partial [Scleroderma citrinum Foug A]